MRLVKTIRDASYTVTSQTLDEDVMMIPVTVVMTLSVMCMFGLEAGLGGSAPTSLGSTSRAFWAVQSLNTVPEPAWSMLVLKPARESFWADFRAPFLLPCPPGRS